jgi:tetratricopeptide (TPR) repeat protein
MHNPQNIKAQIDQLNSKSLDAMEAGNFKQASDLRKAARILQEWFDTGMPDDIPVDLSKSVKTEITKESKTEVIPSPVSRRDDTKRLIGIHYRYLQKLKEQKATLGIHTPPNILIEIEDKEAEIESLQVALGELNREKIQILTQEANRTLSSSRKQLSLVEQTLSKIRSLLFDFADPSSFGTLSEVEKELSNLRDDILRASLGAASNERAGNFERAIECYRSALLRGYDEIIDDTTGEPIETLIVLERALKAYTQDTRKRLTSRHKHALQVQKDGYQNHARIVVMEAINILEQAERYGAGPFLDERNEFIKLEAEFKNTGSQAI